MEFSEPTSCNTLRGTESWLNILLRQWLKHIVIENPKAVRKCFLCTNLGFLAQCLQHGCLKIILPTKYLKTLYILNFEGPTHDLQTVSLQALPST